VDTDPEAVTLWRPAGPEELALVAASGWRAWPPRLAEQPIFYPVLNEEYATMIARDWNVRQSGSGYVTRFRVRRSFLDRYDVHQVGGRTILEYWIPAQALAELNANILGLIELVAEYHQEPRVMSLAALKRWAAHGYETDPASLGDAGSWTQLNEGDLTDVEQPVLLWSHLKRSLANLAKHTHPADRAGQDPAPADAVPARPPRRLPRRHPQRDLFDGRLP
jgi:hypothetical protein